MLEPVELGAALLPEVERQRKVRKQVHQHDEHSANCGLIRKDVYRFEPDARDDNQRQHQTGIEEDRDIGHRLCTPGETGEYRWQYALTRTTEGNTCI